MLENVGVAFYYSSLLYLWFAHAQWVLRRYAELIFGSLRLTVVLESLTVLSAWLMRFNSLVINSTVRDSSVSGSILSDLILTERHTHTMIQPYYVRDLLVSDSIVQS